MKHFQIALALALLSASGAAAHVVLSPDTGPAGSYVFTALRVGHGCAGQPTTGLRVEIPPEILAAKPQPKPGWTVRIERAPLPAPVRGEGGRMLSERVVAISWTGGPLPDDQWDAFGLSAKLPQTTGPLYFPTVQTCGTAEERWSERPASSQAPGQDRHALAHPAPVLRVVAAGAGDAMAGMKMGAP